MSSPELYDRLHVKTPRARVVRVINDHERRVIDLERGLVELGVALHADDEALKELVDEQQKLIHGLSERLCRFDGLTKMTRWARRSTSRPGRPCRCGAGRSGSR